jgi:hypothetical protein
MPSGTEDVTDTLNFASSLVVRNAPQIRELFTAVDSLTTDFQTALDVLETITANDPVFGNLAVELLEAYTAGDTLNLVDVVQLLDSLVATTQYETAYSAVVELLSAFLAQDGLVVAESISVSDTASAAEYLPNGDFGVIIKLVTLLDALQAGDSLTSTFTLMIQDASVVQAGDSVELTAQLLAELTEYVDVFSLLKLPSDVTQGVVMNLEGLRPISEYDNFTYNSLTSFQGKFYGADDTGLYELDGDDDSGDPIQAELSSLMLDFGTSRQKRVRTAYLGYTSTNQLILRVKSVSQGQLSEDWYEAREVTSADAPRANMVYVGQGLKSRYWQFELVNVDGGDFEIDLLEMHPVFLGRRV